MKAGESAGENSLRINTVNHFHDIHIFWWGVGGGGGGGGRSMVTTLFASKTESCWFEDKSCRLDHNGKFHAYAILTPTKCISLTNKFNLYVAVLGIV